MVGMTVWILLQVGKRDTEWRISLSGSERHLLFAVCLLSEGMLFLKGWADPDALGGAFVCFCILWGCLLAACVMDGKEKQVYRFVWKLAGIALTGYAAFGLAGVKDFSVEIVLLQNSCIEYLIFVLLQQGLFSKLYGKADCYAFSLCGGAWIIKGDVFSRCVIHMAISFCLMTIVQLFRQNVTGAGRLKQPVPMIPYITAGFAVCLLLEML